MLDYWSAAIIRPFEDIEVPQWRWSEWGQNLSDASERLDLQVNKQSIQKQQAVSPIPRRDLDS